MITKCRLGDLNIQFDLIYDRTVKHLEPYLLDFDTPDLKLELTQQNFDFERKVVKEACNISYHNKTLEPTVAYRVLAEKLPLFDAAVFHSCAFKVNDRGIALAAKSGTGKSTHMFLWQKLLGEKFQIINGDKPILRLVDGKPYIYGTPWAGKEKPLPSTGKPRTTRICVNPSKRTVFVIPFTAAPEKRAAWKLSPATVVTTLAPS